MPVLSGIRTLDFSNQAGVDIRLRSPGHRDRHRNISATHIKPGTEIDVLRTIQCVEKCAVVNCQRHCGVQDIYNISDKCSVYCRNRTEISISSGRK